jgi:hypothetical protein
VHIHRILTYAKNKYISYDHTMKQPISVTLRTENITWLKGRAGADGLRSVSELLDRLVSEARATGRAGPPRSVVGTIDIDPGDPGLEGADAAVRALFDASLSRPLAVRESTPARTSPMKMSPVKTNPIKTNPRTKRRG